MSTSPKLHAIDLEKGRSMAGSAPSFGLPQRRRKVIVAGLLMFAVLLFVYTTERNGSVLSSSSWGWVKDSMKPESAEGSASVLPQQTPYVAEAKLPGVVSELSEAAPQPLPNLSSPTIVLADDQFQPTAALTALAAKLNVPLPSFSPSGGVQGQPSHEDHVLLLLSAMKKPEYRVPELLVQRTEQLMPSSTSAFVKSLDSIHGIEAGDGKLYVDSHARWLAKHRSLSPLTVFSKSYCPYSKRAKALLTKIGAHFDVYEVDERSDARSLQDGLREVSGHATFPAIFVKEALIGGSDDLARFHDVGVLPGILEAAGVKFD